MIYIDVSLFHQSAFDPVPQHTRSLHFSVQSQTKKPKRNNIRHPSSSPKQKEHRIGYVNPTDQPLHMLAGIIILNEYFAVIIII